MRAWVLVLCLGCGGGGVKDIKDPAASAPAATCKTAGQHLTELVVSMQKTPPPDDAVNAQIEKTAKFCTDGSWSQAAIDCFSRVKTVEEADACTKNLTQAQLEALAGGPRKEEAPVTSSPPPPPPPPPASGADPCDGGE